MRLAMHNRRWLRLKTRRRLTCIIAPGILGVTILLAPLPGVSLLPTFDEGALVAVAITPPGASLKETARISDKIARIIKQAPDVTEVIERVGRPEGSECPETVDLPVDLQRKVLENTYEVYQSVYSNNYGVPHSHNNVRPG